MPEVRSANRLGKLGKALGTRRKLAIVLGGIALGQAILYGPSLIAHERLKRLASEDFDPGRAA
jgi:hypothetical protein